MRLITPIEVRTGMIKDNVLQNEWKEDKVFIESVLGGMVKHEKILLCEDGSRMMGEYSLS